MYEKNFLLDPNDWIRITFDGSGAQPAGWVEGIVITANFYDDSGWYIEYEKENASPSWNIVYGNESGYSYYKQRYDGGIVEKIQPPL